MDCKNARLLLDFARPVPGELDAPEAEALQQHLNQCPDCDVAAQAERRFDDAIGRAMRDVPVPDGLRMRLVARLDRQRDAWYRQFVTRRVLPWTAAAAAVLLLAFLGLFWMQNQRTQLDLAAVSQDANDRFQPKEDRVNEWLRRVSGDHVSSHPDFNYYSLERYFLSELDGQTVPTLYFTEIERGVGFSAWVYVLSDSRFDFGNLENQAHLVTGLNFKVERLKHPANDRVMFVVVYHGDNVQSLFKKTGKSS